LESSMYRFGTTVGGAPLGKRMARASVPHGTSGTKSPYGTPGTLKEKPYRDALRMEISAAAECPAMTHSSRLVSLRAFWLGWGG
jgi:hypothetical protein